MAIIDKPFTSISEADLNDLLVDQVREGKVIDYKQSLPGNADSDKKEFLADVSSFANTNGGHLIYGIKESKGVPIAISGLSIPDIDAAIQRLESLIRDGLQPRLTGVQIAPVPLAGGAHVIVFRIPRSWASPHRVVLGGHGKFHGRNMTGKYSLDVPELRALFALSDSLAERVRSFRASRLSGVVSGEMPIEMDQGPKTVLHLVPLNAFTPGVSYDVVGLASTQLPPIAHSGYSHRLNFDGFLTFAQKSSGTCVSYAQVFRNGCIEAVDGYIILERDGKKLISGSYWEEYLMQAVQLYIKTMEQLEIQPPIVLMLSVLGVRGYSMFLPWGYHGGGHPIDRDSLVMPEIVLETFDFDASQRMRPVFDALWNASGYPHSISYDAQGKWRKPQ